MKEYKFLQDLETQKEALTMLAQHLFDYIQSIPLEQRGDTKKRTGIRVLVREIHSRNMLWINIGDPSELTMFFASEKSSRMEYYGHSSSQQSEKEEKFHFAGAVGYAQFHVSVSGLQAHEDACVAIVLIAKLFDLSVKQVLGSLPKAALPVCLSDPDHYLSKMLKQKKFDK